MVNLDPYRVILERLSRTRPPAQPLKGRDFDEWARLVEIDSTLSGFLTDKINHGSIDWAALGEIRGELVQMDPEDPEMASWHSVLTAELDAIEGLRNSA
ncbi:hypothetical protein [Amycolatopsis granulosa]|uniref:hypothetical protein n=1 Tax=Amycolatopsis granulosa TaxID=185684 RepID=UPI001423E15F|nr:hypothetical protein [Amycolatopsis granulosa]NIH88267.1 hypothetical protein [Amycolatopsis granulosa]